MRVACGRDAPHAPPPATLLLPSTSNLEEYEILRCSFRDTELCCAQNGLRFTRVAFDDHVRGWSDSARTLVSRLGQRPSLHATSNVDLTPHFSAWIHRDSAGTNFSSYAPPTTPSSDTEWHPSWGFEDEEDPDFPVPGPQTSFGSARSSRVPTF